MNDKKLLENWPKKRGTFAPILTLNSPVSDYSSL